MGVHLPNLVHSSSFDSLVFLRCSSREGRTYRISIVSKCGYLGATLSYGKYEQDTVQRRIKAAEFADRHLKTVLRERGAVPLHQRLCVYETCVLSTLKHGIFAAGFGQTEARTMHGMIIRHFRHMANSLRHRTTANMLLVEGAHSGTCNLQNVHRFMDINAKAMVVKECQNFGHLMNSLDDHVLSVTLPREVEVISVIVRVLLHSFNALGLCQLPENIPGN